MIRAADMLIARRADTRAKADFATWKMMAKLNGASALPKEAQTFLQSYNGLLRDMTESEATEATIKLMYQTYYGEMGGAGSAPELPAQTNRQVTDNVTAFKRPPPPRKNVEQKPPPGTGTRPRLPVGLIFACVVLVYVGIRYLWM